MESRRINMSSVSVEPFGIDNGIPTEKIILTNQNGMKAVVTNMGAALVSLYVPKKDGTLTDVVTGHGDPNLYSENPCNFGGTIGRNANRIGAAEFQINGETYHLAKNNYEKNNLHSGPSGYQKRRWNYQIDKENLIVHFTLFSEDTDQGFPGNLTVNLFYQLTEDNKLILTYDASSDKATIINLTNHSYFNLNGHNSGTVLNHYLKVSADFYTPVDECLLPMGENRSVENTPFDFRMGKMVGSDMDILNPDLIYSQGYDHNFVINKGTLSDSPNPVITCIGDKSGIRMDVLTTLPGVQIYSACQTDWPSGKEGAYYKKHSAICFETQYEPDSIHRPNALKPVFSPGEHYHSQTIYAFSNGEVHG